jgi:hypothetical protein
MQRIYAAYEGLPNNSGGHHRARWQPLRDSPLTEDMGKEFQQRRWINSHAASRFPGAGHRGGADGRSGVLGGRTKQLTDPALAAQWRELAEQIERRPG